LAPCCFCTLLLLLPQSERFSKHFASFGREAALLADLNHPNVLRFYGVVTESAADNTVIGIMTEYIRGGSMSSFLRWVRQHNMGWVSCYLQLPVGEVEERRDAAVAGFAGERLCSAPAV
jgi:serine/threonine protein kinase